MKHKLMIKTHNVTGLKYLCYTKKEDKDYDEYKGSGKYWLDHLKEHGDDITTELIYETSDYKEFVKYAREKSIEYNIVDSKDWANLKIEEGDGGNTTSNRIWINDGNVNRYILKEEEIPSGWKRGRINTVFNDPGKQKEFSSRADRKKAGLSIKKAWDEGRFNRDHSKCGKRNKDPEVRQKISKALTGRKFTDEHRKNISDARKGLRRKSK